MAYPNRNYGSGRGRGDRNFSSRGPRPMMHKTICSNCGKEAEVPFKPTGEKPVYCRDCFREMGGGDSRRSEERSERNFSKPQFENRNSDNRNMPAAQYDQQFSSLNAKLDKILGILEAAISAEDFEEEEVVVEAVPEKKKRATKKTA